MYSNHLWALCQAIDLRAMIAKFQARMEVEMRRSLEPFFKDEEEGDEDEHVRETELATLSKKLFNQARVAFNQTAHMDSSSRFTEVLRPLIADLDVFLSMRRNKRQRRRHGHGHGHEHGHEHESGYVQPSMGTFSIAQWHINLATKLGVVYRETRREYYESNGAGTEDLLGKTRAVYIFVRRTLDVSMRKGGDSDREGYDSQLSRIYRSFETGAIVGAFLEALDGDLSSSEVDGNGNGQRRLKAHL
jgi:phenylalanine ammonia-lyase